MSPRRTIREKQSENKELRQLLLKLYEVKHIRLLWQGELSSDLRNALFRTAGTDSFIAKRRYEREVVNLLREEDDEGLSFLRALIDDEGHYLQQEEEILSQYRSRLQQPAEFTDFIANYPQVSVQQFRQFLRRYAQNNDRKAKQKLDSVLISLLFPTAWV